MKNVTKAQYEYALKRIDALLPIVNDTTPEDDPNMAELMIVSDVVESYEKVYYPIAKPTLGEIILDALDNAGMTSKQLAEKLGISPSRISDYIHNRSEPTLRIARQLCQILNIAPAEMLQM